MDVLSIIFWGLLVISFAVFTHELGHYLAARFLHVRATELFMGMPCRYRLSFQSKRTGTHIGVTPLLLGGYTRICGMSCEQDPRLADVLASVSRRGTATVATVAHDIGCDDLDEVLRLLESLEDWASIEQLSTQTSRAQVEDISDVTYRTVARDAHGLTIYDKGSCVNEDGGTCAGAPLTIDDPEAYLQEERSHTYLGCGFWRRAAILVAGPLTNICCGVLAIIVVLSVIGIDIPNSKPMIGEVQVDSLAEEAGLLSGDIITEIDGEAIASWDDIRTVLSELLEGTDSFEIVWERNGTEMSALISPSSSDTQLGIVQGTTTYRFSILDSLLVTGSYIVQLVSFIVQLFIPSHTVEVLNQSTSIVGIAYMSQQAAAAGASEFLNIIASISMSLAFMNLLPIPPLDGGKLFLEVIEVIRKKPVSQGIANGLSIAGMLFFLVIFVWVLRADIIRYVLT